MNRIIMSNAVKYADVILPLPIRGSFTYLVAINLDLDIGQRVVVQFGSRKLYTAIVLKIHNEKPKEYDAKELLAILDEKPIINEKQLQFWLWIAEYYMCNLGDVMNAALPSSFKLASESKVIIHTDFDGDLEGLSEKETTIVNALLRQEELLVQEIIPLINNKNVFTIINEMIRKEIVLIKEDLHDKYKEKIIRIVELVDENLQIKLTEKQKKLCLRFSDLKIKFPKKKWTVPDLLKKVKVSRGVLDALVKKGVFKIELQSISRLLSAYKKTEPSKKLTKPQLKAYGHIKEGFKEKKVCLLHGVTSSGKTEIYIKLIEEQLAKGKQVLYLLPEIALTTQIINRLRKYFGNKVGVTHSHLNNFERVEVWKAVQEQDKEKVQYPIMLGARSALFLPYDNLGLIIVDEEHDPSYKQHQPAPRYHARDAAIYLANIHNTPLLLGSATPALESYYNATERKYNLVELNSRYQDLKLPKIECVDIRKAHLKKKMQAQFTPELLDEIKETIANGKQVILFQNRRGYSPVLSCATCAFTPNCKHCDVSLTYHKWQNQIKCHYCGFAENLPTICPSCNATDFSSKGFGTEQIQESLNTLLPEATISRMDYDTTRKKFAHQEIIREFEQGRIDILVGTQMVTKGLDFDNVAVVGILNADNMLHYPDFRAYERAFQLMMQVAGRAGRKGKQGKVLLQTYDDTHGVIQFLKAHDFKHFYTEQIAERKLFNYPPFSRIIGITLKHKDKNRLDKAANQLATQLRKSFGHRVLGPEYPSISRIRNYYHKDILLKIEQKASVKKAKTFLATIIKKLQEQKDFRSVRIILDVDKV
ncbi:MAG: primosomal protein N' [Bacteroidota bacterium]|nr:primosomal protein N' [Bacteroidota bacterium]